MRRTALVLLAFAVACGSAGDPVEQVLEEAQRRFELGEIDAGLELLAAALESMPPGDREARARIHEGLAHGETRRSDPEAALVQAERAIELAPEHAWAWYAMGVASNTIGDYGAAVAGFDESLRLDPTDVKALEWRASTKALLGRHEEAVRDLTRALDELEGADDARVAHWRVSRDVLARELRLLRANSLEELGRYDEARADRGSP